MGQGPQPADAKTPEPAPNRLSRRELLIAGSVAAGGIYLGLDKKLTARGTPSRGRVIVVGTGLAGLSAAWELERRGWSVLVLEARSRIGGPLA